MNRLQQAVLIGTLVGFSWLAMQVVHEFGHVLVARMTGAAVVKVVLHPMTVSRTDLGGNPHPLAVVWGGPLVGSALPVLAFWIASIFQVPYLYLLRFFAGFCLIANGVYIGLGWRLANGADPGVMIGNGSPVWLLIVFGILTFPSGLYLWHRQGRYFGLGTAGGKVDGHATIISAILFLGLIVVECLLGNRS